MNQSKESRFEEALVRYRKKWDKIKDPCVMYKFPIPRTSCKELFLQRVKEHPNKTYIMHKGKSYTYAECNELAARLANGMFGCGLRKGDRVITYVSNGYEFVAIAQACFKTGIIMVNTNPPFHRGRDHAPHCGLHAKARHCRLGRCGCGP